MIEPGAFRHVSVGDIDVWVFVDGAVELPLALFPAADEPGADPSIGPGPFPTAVNCFAIRTGGALHLVDAGCGHWRGPGCGHLVPAMKAAGLDPAGVRSIVMTHLHGDHAGGLIDEAGAAFPQAELVLSDVEAGYWGDPGLAARIPERMKATLVTAQKALAAYEGRIRLVRDREDILPGVTVVSLPGHTPGQIGLRVESAGERLFIWADVVHVAAIQFAHPDWTIGFDTDGARAAATRTGVFAECVAAGTRIGGMHLSPAIGRVVERDSTYAFEAETP